MNIKKFFWGIKKIFCLSLKKKKKKKIAVKKNLLLSQVYYIYKLNLFLRMFCESGPRIS